MSEVTILIKTKPMTEWALHYREIPEAVETNDELRETILELVGERPIHGKAVEGGDRTEQLREILTDFFNCELGFEEAFQRVSQDLPRLQSRHSGSNRVFPSDWTQKLIRTQGNRFYNQGALHILQERGDEQCYVPHSPHEDRGSKCTQQLAGGEFSVDTLLDRLEQKYDHENYDVGVSIPNRPNCTHTVVPVSYWQEQN